MKECSICRILRTNDILYICNECKEIIDAKYTNNKLYCSLHCKGIYEAKNIIGVQTAARIEFHGVIDGIMRHDISYRGDKYWRTKPKIQSINPIKEFPSIKIVNF